MAANKGPKYEAFVKEAILALKERTGSSLQAIKKYIQANHKEELKQNWESQLSQTIKRLAKSGKLIKVTLTGCHHQANLNLFVKQLATFYQFVKSSLIVCDVLLSLFASFV